MLFRSIIQLTVVAGALALPTFIDPRQTESAPAWDSGWQKSVQIHESCNATQRGYLEHALSDMVALAQHARDRALRFGAEDELYAPVLVNRSVP
jgi:hypothetical protein